jgi:hypothetical protein
MLNPIEISLIGLLDMMQEVDVVIVYALAICKAQLLPMIGEGQFLRSHSTEQYQLTISKPPVNA